MLSFRAVFSIEFFLADYRKWLPSKKLTNFYLFPVSLGQV